MGLMGLGVESHFFYLKTGYGYWVKGNGSKVHDFFIVML